ncbi:MULTISPECIES: hypothetical protein [unclassified Gilliamella]|uniref:hypothetical protein n=1 Tax=unclassified Gilliamella TaxID=2685620 RepID=UPI000A34B3A4|nr:MULTISPECIES: hypothetical protein [unclassified Gilliamella]OTQ75346.1 hypothetical protein B6C99_02010 [Gilliamella sp. N-G2]OTQ79267.1 hypothetical protein B6D23_06265 [Gilliamella sp. N-W3]
MNCNLITCYIDITLRTQPYAKLCYFGKRLQYLNTDEVDMFISAEPNSRIDVDVPVTLCP